MEREFSAGGVLVKVIRGRPMVAAIRPRGKPEGHLGAPEGEHRPGRAAGGDGAPGGARRRPASRARSSRSSATCATRTPAAAALRVFKVVSFYLLRAGRGRIGEIDEAMRVEVAEARWLPLDEAPRLLAYGGEREMAAKARDRFGA